MFEKLQTGEKIHDAPGQPQTCSHPIYARTLTGVCQVIRIFSLCFMYSKCCSLPMKAATCIRFSHNLSQLDPYLRYYLECTRNQQKNFLPSYIVFFFNQDLLWLDYIRQASPWMVLGQRKGKGILQKKKKDWAGMSSEIGLFMGH